MGMPGLVHPKADFLLSSLAAEKGMPYCLSTLGNITPEEFKNVRNGKVLNSDIFQLYPPKSENILNDIIERVEMAGFKNLLITIDIPAPSRREYSKSYGLKIPFSFTLNLILQSLTRPRWLINQFFYGFPRLKTVERYSDNNNLRFVSNFAGNRLGGNPSWKDLKKIRDKWSGKLIIKGVLSEKDVTNAIKIGFDVVYISNHGGRQFDGAPSSLESLKRIKKMRNSKIEIWFDGGVRDGLDILKALALGADLVFLGRPFLYALYNSKKSLEVAYQNLEDQFKNNMFQLGVPDVKSIQELIPDK
jgi:L-lactate dehydrogenase (cytochrome)